MRATLILCVAFLGLLVLVPTASTEPAASNLEEVLQSVGATYFLSFINFYPSLKSVLTSPDTSPYTIFAPTNEAFTQEKNLTSLNLLKYHLVQGNFATSTFSVGQLLETLYLPDSLNQNQKVKITSVTPDYVVNDATITSPNNVATNGIVHVINQVLIAPPNIELTLASIPEFSSFTAALEVANLTDDASSIPSITVFAPTDDAFASAPALVNYLLLPQQESADDLLNVLTYHAVDAVFYSASFTTTGNTVEAFNKEPLTIMKTAEGVEVGSNGATIIEDDILADNGVIQAIDQILLPPNFSFDLTKLLLGLNATSFYNALVGQELLGMFRDLQDNYTIFAPTNAAFESLGSEFPSRELLLFHVSKGVVMPTQLTDGALIESLADLASLDQAPQMIKVTISSNGTFVDNSPLASSANYAVNGVIYLVGEVFVLPGNVTTAADQAGLVTFASLVEHSNNLTELFEPAITVFAPTEAAFAMIPEPEVDYLLSMYGAADLRNILLNHAVSGIYYSSDITGTVKLTTFSNQSITVTLTNGTISVDTYAVKVPNVIASNGVIHGIAGVLLPSTYQFTTEKALLGYNTSVFLQYLNDTLGPEFLATGTYTILAPNNTAFEMADLGDSVDNKEALTQVVQDHILVGSKSLTSGTSYTTLSGKSVKVSENQGVLDLSLKGYKGSAKVSSFVQTDNGNVYVLNTVLGSQGKESSSSSDKTTTIILAVTIPVGLLLIGLIIGVVVYVRRRKMGQYEPLPADIPAAAPVRSAKIY